MAIFLGVLWLTPPAAPASPLPRRVMIAGRVLGVALVVAGAWGLSRALFIEPAHYPPPPQATLRQREAFLYAGVLWCYPVAFGLRLIRGRAAGRDVERLGLFIALVLVTHLAAKQSVQGLPVLPYGRPGLALALNSVEVVLGPSCSYRAYRATSACSPSWAPVSACASLVCPLGSSTRACATCCRW